MNIYHIHIKGLVQGVGFRPFVCRIAREMGLCGEIRNNNEGVYIEIEVNSYLKDLFISRILKESPTASAIDSMDVKIEEGLPYRKTFSIHNSENISEKVTRISPDIAVCPDCLQDMKAQLTRKSYPFVNCTNCGPRFSIIEDLPYDRPTTSMSTFEMCDDCHKEYVDIFDRRFHAQPIACNECGPSYSFTEKGAEGKLIHSYVDPEIFFTRMAMHIKNGYVISFKGLGGYNLICDAFDPIAVGRLRDIKKREAKPFALMFRNEECAEKYLELDETEKKILSSWQRPIILARVRKQINTQINGGLSTLGTMLPYLPAHHLLFEQLDTDALIFTSGNISDEPIIIKNEEAEKKLLPVCNIQADHNRPIVNRVDDSVVQVINGTSRMIRRSRGYVPNPHISTLNLEGVLAFGAEKSNTFAIGKGNEAIISQHIGDLQNIETLDFYQETISRFEKMFRFSADMLVCDLHPDYSSTRFANEIAKKTGVTLTHVQHHHAHAVACMEEHHLTGNHLAIILDGTGYGTDGKIWGGEFFICNHLDFERVAHFDYIPLPGGDKSIKEPWRTAIGFLEYYHIKPPLNFVTRHRDAYEILSKMIKRELNSPQSCGVGRIFDAVSALLNCCDKSTYQGEAPIRLEHIANDNYSDHYLFDQQNPLCGHTVFEALVEDLEKGVDRNLIAAKFHNTLVEQILTQLRTIYHRHSLPRKIILAGGCFQNRRLSTMLERKITQEGLIPVVPRTFPTNDGGIALGQISIAATKRNKDHA